MMSQSIHYSMVDVSSYLDSMSRSDVSEPPAEIKPISTESDAPPAKRSVSESAFISLLFAIIISWILVALWTRTVENFVFGTLGLDGDSTVHSLIVAVALSITFFMLIWMLDQYDVVIGGIERLVESESLIPAP